MTDNRKNSRYISRRVVLQGAQLAVTAGVAAQVGSCAGVLGPKLSKEDAKYQDMPSGQQRCAGCVHFESPNACSVVEGTISPNGWCQRYSAKS
jgi:hypothetical protein